MKLNKRGLDADQVGKCFLYTGWNCERSDSGKLKKRKISRDVKKWERGKENGEKNGEQH